MSMVAYDVIIVTSYDRNRIALAHSHAPEPKSEPIESTINGDWTFIVGPDGSKEGWPESDQGDRDRETFKTWLRDQSFEDDSSPYNWVEVRYGSELKGHGLNPAEITDSRWMKHPESEHAPIEADEGETVGIHCPVLGRMVESCGYDRKPNPKCIGSVCWRHDNKILPEDKARAILREYPDADLSEFTIEGDKTADELAVEETEKTTAALEAKAAEKEQETMAAKERTFAIIKPDAVRKGVIGPILDMAYRANLIPHRMVMTEMPFVFWKSFYAEHRERDFFGELVDFMSSGPSVFILLEGPDAVRRWRELMGATDPKKAQAHTVRGKFGVGGPANAVHGSDSIESARREALLFGRHEHHDTMTFHYSNEDPLGEAGLVD